MSGFFLIISLVIVLAVIPTYFKAKGNRDRSRIINADWLDSL